MFLLSLKNFLRSKIVVSGLLIVLVAGIIGIAIGRQHLAKQKAAIEKTVEFQQEHIQRNVQYFDKEMGLLLYYLRFAYINPSPPLNGLSIGQRDVNSSIQAITIRGLEGQKYDTDLYNPSNLLAGNLDFGFVLIYLFPLLIIAVTYSLLSEEKEGGTWRLVAVQSRRPVSVLLQKLYLRAIVIYALLSFLLLLAKLMLVIPFNAAFAATWGIAFLYIAFWLAMCFWVVSWQRSSGSNAVSLLSIWLLLTIILPAGINNYIAARYSVPEALATTVEQRQAYHEKWDMDKAPTVEKFYAHYPQFKKYPLPDKEFSWLWYYAMQQMGDDHAQQHAAEMKEKLHQRNRAANLFGLFIPTVHTQLQLNELTNSGLGNQLQFLDSTAAFHERLRLYFYPKIFSEAAVKGENWGRFKAEYFNAPVGVNGLKMYGPFIVIIIGLLLLSAFNFKRNLSP